MLLGSEIDLLCGEISNAIVVVARHHRMVGQMHHAPVCYDALCEPWSLLATASRTSRSWTGRRRRRCSLRRFDFNVLRECNRSLDERSLIVNRAARRSEFRDARRVQSRYIDDRCAVRPVRFYRENRNDRGIARLGHCLIDRQRRIRRECERWTSENHAIAGSLPTESPCGELIASISI